MRSPECNAVKPLSVITPVFESPRAHWLRRALRQVADRFSVACCEELQFLKKSLNQGLTYKLINIKCRPGLHFTNFKVRILLKEAISFLKILLKIGETNTFNF